MGRALVPRGELHLRLDAEQTGALTAFAARSHLPANAAVKVLLQRGLESLEASDPEAGDQLRSRLRTVALLALGALVAAEESRLMLGLMLRNGREKLAELGEDPATYARQRLEALEGVLEDYAL